MAMLDRIPEKYKVRVTVFTIGILLAAVIALAVLYATKGSNCNTPEVGPEEDDGSVNSEGKIVNSQVKARRGVDIRAAQGLRALIEDRPVAGEAGAAVPAAPLSFVVVRAYRDGPEQRKLLSEFLQEWEPAGGDALIVASAGPFPRHAFSEDVLTQKRVTVREFKNGAVTDMAIFTQALHELQDDSLLQNYTHIAMLRGDVQGPLLPSWMRRGNWSRISSSAWLHPLAESLDRKRILLGLRLSPGTLRLTDELLVMQTADVPTLQMWSFFKNTLQAEQPDVVMRDLCQAIVSHDFEF